jgi:hypothetical protein
LKQAAHSGSDVFEIKAFEIRASFVIEYLVIRHSAGL